jgi:hypothetical protein
MMAFYFSISLHLFIQDEALRKIPLNAVKEQVAIARQGGRIRIGNRSYPTIFIPRTAGWLLLGGPIGKKKYFS